MLELMTKSLDFNDTPHLHPAPGEPDQAVMGIYLDVVFGYLDGMLPFRGFVDQGQGHGGKPYNEWVDISRGDTLNVIFNMASYCAGNGTAAYCIPGTVEDRGKAGPCRQVLRRAYTHH